MLIGYMRPYQDDLNCEAQQKILHAVTCESIITEDYSCSKKRAELRNILDNLTTGDKLIVANLFALADSTRNLVELLQIISGKGAYFQSLNEEIDTSNKMGYHLIDIVKHLVEFQSNVISEKTKKGIYEAKQKGITSGRPRKSEENVKRAIVMYQSKKYSLSKIKDETGISKSTLYRYLDSLSNES